jgi:DNA repair protein RAD50
MAELESISGGALLDDLKSVQSKLSKLNDQRAELRGSKQSEEAQASGLISQLTSERFRHIEQRYRTKLIEVRTNTLANQDLETYYRALDKALMHYHSIKMKEINETLKVSENTHTNIATHARIDASGI